MKLESPDFENQGFIPKKFTCDGEDINPSLIIEDIPEGTRRLALIMEDPDAPMGTWVHSNLIEGDNVFGRTNIEI